MLRRFTHYTLTLLELLEAEARNLGSGLVKAGTNLALAVVGVLLIGGAASVFGWSLFLALRPVWGPAGAAAACGVLLLLLGLLLLLFVSSRVKDR